MGLVKSLWGVWCLVYSGVEYCSAMCIVRALGEGGGRGQKKHPKHNPDVCHDVIHMSAMTSSRCVPWRPKISGLWSQVFEVKGNYTVLTNVLKNIHLENENFAVRNAKLEDFSEWNMYRYYCMAAMCPFSKNRQSVTVYHSTLSF